MYGLKKRSKQDESGLIEGAGTGTSDSIQKDVPVGSYIMPADSTEKIGSKNLKKLGNPQSSVGVNVSDGEYLADPNQLQAIGGFVLDRMKQATHTPVDQPQLGFKPGNTKPQMFFANGGSVGGFAKNMLAPEHDDGTWNPVGGIVNAATGLGKAAVGTAGGLVGGIGEGSRSLGSAVANADNSNRGNIVGPSFDFAGEGLKQAQLGLRQTFGLTPNKEDPADVGATLSNNSATQPEPKKAPDLATQAAEKTQTDAAAKATANTTPPTTQSVFDQDQPTSNQQTTKPNPFAIQQNGNSFSYADPGAASQARANGLSDGGGFGLKVRPANDPVGVKNMFANTREMGPTDQQIQNAVAQREMNLGMQGFGGIARQPQAPQRTAEQEAERQQIMRELHTPYKGSQNGQLTARQMDNIVRMQTGDDDRAQQRYVTDANNAANIAQTGMREAAQTGRTAMQEQGSNDRFNSNLNLDAQKFNASNDLANRQFVLDQNRYMPEIMKQRAEISALQRYEQAQTPEERQAAERILGAIRGQQAQKGGLKAVYGGQTLTDQGAIRNPDIVLDENGRQIDYGASQKQQQQMPKVGAVINGYKYKGGDLNKAESWEKA
ncbi:hypothetical protein [Acinetobacter ursingii]|uniref:hypothetical protein n=1 Tax=Acinetobacter ursingii TaxID=108980 RepID=UPI003AF56D6E